MSTLQLTVPDRNTGETRLKFKSRDISQWLDDLPYMDVPRAARAASEQLRLMNRQTMAAGSRLDILQSFLATRKRLHDSLPSTPAQINTPQRDLDHLCQDIGFGYKITVHELVNRRSGFIEQRHLPQALLGAIYTLGLQQRHYYESHKQLPRALWTECLDLFLFAREQGRAHYQGQLPGAGQVSIEDCFKLIALIRLSDPYSTPAGLTALLAGYFARHTSLVQLHSLPDGEHEAIGMVLNSRHQLDNGTRTGRLYLDVSPLIKQMTSDLTRLQAGQKPSALGLPTEVPTPILENTLSQLHRLWQEQLQRKDEREPAHSAIELVSGLEAIYCVLNMGRHFDPSMFVEPGTENNIDLGSLPSQTPAADRSLPEPLRCSCLNRCNGGLAIQYPGNEPGIRKPVAGQLLAIRRPGAKTSQGWVIGICRWLIANPNHTGFELGLQYITRQPHAVVVKTAAPGDNHGSFQPAIAARQQRGGQPVRTLITAAGQQITGKEIDLYEGAEPHRIKSTELLESGTGFERHLYEIR